MQRLIQKTSEFTAKNQLSSQTFNAKIQRQVIILLNHGLIAIQDNFSRGHVSRQKHIIHEIH